MPPAYKQPHAFNKDEKILCYHGPHLYEARVLDLEPEKADEPKGAWQYFVHYMGWKATWDSWVAESRCLKATPENKELADSLKAQARQEQRDRDADKKRNSTKRSDRGSMRGSEERSVSAQAGPRGTKRGRDYEIEKMARTKHTPRLTPSELNAVRQRIVREVKALGTSQDRSSCAIESSTSDSLSEEESGEEDPLLENTEDDASSDSVSVGTPVPKIVVKKIILPECLERLNASDFVPILKNMIADIQQEESFKSKPAIKIPLSDQLKSLLVDDWENITRHLSLVPLPHPKPVSQLLDDYYETAVQRRTPGHERDVLYEIRRGLEAYFDKALPRLLLYRLERQQWLDLQERMLGEKREKQKIDSVADGLDHGAIDIDITGFSPSQVYGAEHLARLFCSLPELIAQTNMDAATVQRLREEMSKMSSWLSKHSREYFCPTYFAPGEEYIAETKAINW